jgi:hypothetical protein
MVINLLYVVSSNKREKNAPNNRPLSLEGEGQGEGESA